MSNPFGLLNTGWLNILSMLAQYIGLFSFCVLILPFTSGESFAKARQANLREQSVRTMRKAAGFFRAGVASHGGYVYYYSTDLKQRWGEGTATADQIWVQPPGTPTVGMAYLKAYEATGDQFYLDAATEAAEALIYGQLQSGGWTNYIDFNPQGRVALYRNGRGRGKNNSSLDDGQTQSAIRFLVLADKALKFEPLAIASDESQEVIGTLMIIYDVTSDPKYLEPIPRAIEYLRRSLLPDGRLARFYELRSNKPLYMKLKGDVYTLTCDDSDLPSHYGWKIDSRLDDLEARYDELKDGTAA